MVKIELAIQTAPKAMTGLSNQPARITVKEIPISKTTCPAFWAPTSASKAENPNHEQINNQTNVGTNNSNEYVVPHKNHTCENEIVAVLHVAPTVNKSSALF